MKRRANVVFNGGSASARFAVRGSDSNFPEPGERATPSLTGDAMSLVEQERRLLVQALEKTNGKQTQAARLLRITRDSLRYKMKKFNLRYFLVSRLIISIPPS